MESAEKCRIRQRQPDVVARRHARQKERYLTEPEFREAGRRRARKYYNIHKNVIRIRSKQCPWYKNNRLDWMRKYQAVMREKNIYYRIRNRLSSRLWHAVVASGGTKAFKTMELIGCTLNEFRTYFERKFTNGMSWDAFKYGLIHIDHIKPCVLFDLSNPEEQKSCFHFSNLQPLWASDNLAKKDSY